MTIIDTLEDMLFKLYCESNPKERSTIEKVSSFIGTLRIDENTHKSASENIMRGTSTKISSSSNS